MGRSGANNNFECAQKKVEEHVRRMDHLYPLLFRQPPPRRLSGATETDAFTDSSIDTSRSSTAPSENTNKATSDVLLEPPERLDPRLFVDKVDDLECPMCYGILRKPIDCSGTQRHSFCGVCLERWLETSERKCCPLCRYGA